MLRLKIITPAFTIIYDHYQGTQINPLLLKCECEMLSTVSIYSLDVCAFS